MGWTRSEVELVVREGAWPPVNVSLAEALLELDDAARELLRVLETDGGYTEDALAEAQQALGVKTLQPQAAMRALRACLLRRET